MKVLLALLLAIASMFALPTPAQAQASPALAKTVNDAVVLLYTQDASGGMSMLCSATAYKKVDKQTYRFASASHCVAGKTEVEQKAAKYFVSFDSAGAKTFFPASLIEAGDKNVGDDFSIFTVKTDKDLTIVPLGDDSQIQVGSEVISVAAPLGLGKQYFQGYVSELQIDRPPLDAGIVQWHGAMLVMIGGAPGSSGSAIVSADQKAIVGFLVGSAADNIGMIVLPVSQFKAFEAAVDAGKYKKTKIGDTLAGSNDQEIGEEP